ncbi:single-stranded DNA-binding protein [Taibaiella koreensis]|uniref:single-stranded DNA-binding protein n=1 Tax=Taibaiella koreensis TaxID=1268548 RepID=UPI000E5991E8|nr:single-stranded DNA-binding protein [Taibaiella koreensis]
MQQVTGRLTADATVKMLESGQVVVNFSIADNQDYKPKGATEWVKNPTFFSCAYWGRTAIAKVLRKGTEVLLQGQIKTRIYRTNTDEIGAALNFKVRDIQIIKYAAKAADNAGAGDLQEVQPQGKDKDDLPF